MAIAALAAGAAANPDNSGAHLGSGASGGSQAAESTQPASGPSGGFGGSSTGSSLAGANTGGSTGAATNATSSSSSSNNNNSKKTSSTSGTTLELLGGCSVCSDDQGTEENPLVYCDGCELAVHQACYGIVSVPPGNWFCGKCEVGHTQHEIKCELCPSRDGALKRTETGLWAHVVCALYIPEVRFGNNNTMEPIEIKHIQAERYSRSCYLCKEMGETSRADYGAVMDCHKASCKQSFHVTCAQAAGLLCEEASQASDNVIYCGYCKHHFRKLKAAGSRKSGSSLINSNSGSSTSNNNHNSSINASGLSYADSASDSSQDNDSRCNTTVGHDKSSTNRNSKSHSNPSILAPATTISASTAAATNSSSLPEALTKTTTNSHQAPTSLLPPASSATNKTSPAKNALISLTLPYNLAAGDNNNNKQASSSPQKKKRNTKNASGISSDYTPSADSKSVSATNSSTLPPMPLPTGSTEFGDHQSSGPGSDVYSWPDKDNDKASFSSSKNKKKKLTTSNTQSTSAKSSSLSISQLPPFNPNSNLQKNISSPNLSLTTSPSNSTKSNSSSSTASLSTSVTSSSSSSSSTTSGSPSPAQISPNISGRGLNAANKPLESPLATNSKTNSAPVPHNNDGLYDMPTCNITLPTGQTALSTRINLDDPKIDLKKSSLSSSSLLSTTVPMTTISEPLIDSQTPRTFANYKLDTVAPTKLNFTNTTNTSNSALGSQQPHKASTNATGTLLNNTQPLVPPLVIPVPQIIASATQQASKSKSSTVKNKRKKSTDGPENLKTEPKPKPPSKSSKTPKADPVEPPKQAPPKTDTKKGSRASKTSASSKLSELSAVPSQPKDNPAKTEPQPTASSPNKRKSRSNSSESTPSPAKRVRKKKSDQPPATDPTKTAPTSNIQPPPPPPPTSITAPTASTCMVGPGPLLISTPVVGNRLVQGMNSLDVHDMNSRYFSPLISPYPGIDQLNAPSLSRSSLSRLFSTSLNDANHGPFDEITKAFDELRESTWNHLSKCVLDHAQQFDIPSLIGTLYSLRTENEKLVNKVRDLTAKRDQLLAMSARLDLPGPMLTQHLNNTSPNFSSVVSGLANSPKSLPMPSPGAPISKAPLVSVGPYGHMPPGPLGPPSYGLDRSSPFAGQPHSTLNSIKPSSISAPSPPIGAMMAHSTNIRPGGLVAMNPPYPANIFPPINSMNSMNPNPQSSAFYPRQ